MKLLLKYTSLNKDICNIVFHYINYNKDNIISILQKTNYATHMMSLKDGMTLIDIIILCVKIGYKGFYIDNASKSCIEIINWYYNNHNQDKLKIMKNEHNNKLFYSIEDVDNKYRCVNILALSVFETII